LVPRLENLLTAPSADQLANMISDEAWACLPERCCGLLLCFTSDLLDVRRVGGLMFIAAPGRVYGDGLTQYLADIGILGVVVAAYLFVQRP
jgi:hypothetical protein